MRQRCRHRLTLAHAALVVAFAIVQFNAPDAFARSVARVSFPSLDRDDHGAPVQIQAVLLMPDGPMPAGGFPAVAA